MDARSDGSGVRKIWQPLAAGSCALLACALLALAGPLRVQTAAQQPGAGGRQNQLTVASNLIFHF